MENNGLVRAGPSKGWSVDRIVELKLSAEQIGILKANALDDADEDVAQVCEDALVVMPASG